MFKLRKPAFFVWAVMSLLAPQSAPGLSFAYDPASSIAESDTVAKGQLGLTETSVTLSVESPLKGDLQRGQLLYVSCGDLSQLAHFDLYHWVKLMPHGSYILVGDRIDDRLILKYLNLTIWPEVGVEANWERSDKLFVDVDESERYARSIIDYQRIQQEGSNRLADRLIADVATTESRVAALSYLNFWSQKVSPEERPVWSDTVAVAAAEIAKSDTIDPKTVSYVTSIQNSMPRSVILPYLARAARVCTGMTQREAYSRVRMEFYQPNPRATVIKLSPGQNPPPEKFDPAPEALEARVQSELPNLRKRDLQTLGQRLYESQIPAVADRASQVYAAIFGEKATRAADPKAEREYWRGRIGQMQAAWRKEREPGSYLVKGTPVPTNVIFPNGHP